ncbi:hypothetical protein ACO0R3_004034 [Hanseniaspora guilliermondii]
MFKSRTTNKNIKSIFHNEDDCMNSKSYDSELIFTFNSPIKKNPFLDKQNATSHLKDFNSLNYFTTDDILIKTTNNYNNDADNQSQETIEIGSFNSNMTQEIPSTLMMNVKDPPPYENVIKSSLPKYKHIIKENPSSKLETNTLKMHEILECEKYLTMPSRNSISLKDSLSCTLLSRLKGNAYNKESIMNNADNYSSSSDEEYLTSKDKKFKQVDDLNSIILEKQNNNQDWLVTQFLIDEYSVHGRAYENKRRKSDHGFGMLEEDMFDSSSDEE